MRPSQKGQLDAAINTKTQSKAHLHPAEFHGCDFTNSQHEALACQCYHIGRDLDTDAYCNHYDTNHAKNPLHEIRRTGVPRLKAIQRNQSSFQKQPRPEAAAVGLTGNSLLKAGPAKE
jgi:hypothetical protein